MLTMARFPAFCDTLLLNPRLPVRERAGHTALEPQRRVRLSLGAPQGGVEMLRGGISLLNGVDGGCSTMLTMACMFYTLHLESFNPQPLNVQETRHWNHNVGSVFGNSMQVRRGVYRGTLRCTGVPRS